MIAGYAFWALTTGGRPSSPRRPRSCSRWLFTLVVGTAIELLAFRPLRNAAPLAKLVSSLGVLLVLQAAMLLAFGTTQQPAAGGAAEPTPCT